MEQEYQPGVDDSALCPPEQAEDPVELLLAALHDLKANIARVEASHPRLRKDLSELCDLVIDHVSRPVEQQISQVLEPADLAACEESAAAAEPPEDDPLVSRYLEYLHRSHSPGYEPPDRPPSPAAPGNPFDSAVDSSGGPLGRALDKIGDGIIFVFEKLLSLGERRPRQ